jgi:hypothetical protein
VLLDDNAYVTENPHVKSGLTLENIIWAFSRTHGGLWIPTTWISYMLEIELHGMASGLFHLTNVFLHTANVLLLFLVVKRMTRKMWQSAFVAALFALHPMHVESVVWVTERKDVLSMFFLMLTMWGYAKYVEKPHIAGYLLVLFSFGMWLMAKPVIVTLPFLFLLLDFWPLQRLQIDQSAYAKSGLTRLPSLYLLLEKIPLFILSAIISIVTISATYSIGGVQSLDVLSLNVRIANALVSYIKYLGKMVYPIGLAVLYPYPEMPTIWKVIGALMLFAANILFCYQKPT